MFIDSSTYMEQLPSQVDFSVSIKVHSEYEHHHSYQETNRVL